MNTKNEADNRSPWPACADCQIAEEHGTTSEAACTVRAEHDVAAEASFDGLEPAAELGPRRDAVRQAAEEAFARAMARANDREKKAEQIEAQRTG
jgi:uncharacterized protein (DUF1501 family)